KIIHDDGSTWAWTTKRVPMLDTATLRALVVAAHMRGKLAVVHVLSEGQARDAIEADADGLAHMFMGDSVSADFGELVARHHAFVILTLSTLYPFCGRMDQSASLADAFPGTLIRPEWRKLMLVKSDASHEHHCKGTDDGMRQLIRAHVPLL